MYCKSNPACLQYNYSAEKIERLIVLDCSIDSLLSPRELFILEAVYTDGQTHIPVTHFLNDMVRDNALNIYVNTPFIGVLLESDRLKILTVKFQTPT